MRRILTIAGSDSGGGAGIQGDLKAITVLGGYGMSVITAVTAQNTVGVQAVLELPLDLIEAQIDSVITDMGVDALKTGMLSSSGVVSLVVRKIKEYGIRCVVVDPVMVAKSGDPLLKQEAVKVLRQDLIPIAEVITPNLSEASALCGFDVHNQKDMRRAALKIRKMGARNVLVKGGHLGGDPVDILYDGETFQEYPTQRIATPNTHGTGCSFASALATELAKGKDIRQSILAAKAFMTTAIRFSLPLGRGHGPTNPYAFIVRAAERFDVMERLKRAYERLRVSGIGALIPEVQSNLGFALSCAASNEDVAAFPGRIVKVRDSIATVSGPVFGASRHVANIILTLMRRNAAFRSSMNIRFSDDITSACEEAGLTIRHFDRSQEPTDVKEREGASLEWGIDLVLKQEGIPDVIYDRGDVGKEPMVRVVGRDPEEVVQKVLAIRRHLKP